jgi:hypothetical protein
MLLEMAWASTRMKNSSMRQRYLRLSRRKVHKRLIVTIAHATLRAVWEASCNRKRKSVTTDSSRTQHPWLLGGMFRPSRALVTKPFELALSLPIRPLSGRYKRNCPAPIT